VCNDAACAVSWNGVTSVAPSKNAIYDLIENQVFKVSTLSHLVPIFWYGTEAQKAIDFPSGVPSNYFTITSDGATTAIEGTDLASTGETAGYVLQADGDGTCSWVALASGGDALTTNPLSQFAATTKAQLNGVISDGTPMYVGDTPTAHTHTASEVTDFDTEVSNNASVVANTAKVTYPSADATKVGFISVTQAVDLDTMESNIATNNAKVTYNPVCEFVVAISDETTDLTVGTGKIIFRMPYAMTLSSIRASVTTAPTGANLIIDVKQNGTSIFTTNLLSIDATEKTSTTATTAPSITTSALTDDAEITIDITQIGSTIAGTGAKVTFKGTRA